MGHHPWASQGSPARSIPRSRRWPRFRRRSQDRRRPAGCTADWRGRARPTGPTPCPAPSNTTFMSRLVFSKRHVSTTMLKPCCFSCRMAGMAWNGPPCVTRDSQRVLSWARAGRPSWSRRGSPRPGCTRPWPTSARTAWRLDRGARRGWPGGDNWGDTVLACQDGAGWEHDGADDEQQAAAGPHGEAPLCHGCQVVRSRTCTYMEARRRCQRGAAFTDRVVPR